MDVGFVSAISALAGSIVGGLTSTGTTWLTQRAQSRAGEMVHQMMRREDLYRDFIVAASGAYGDALVSNEPRIAEVVGLYSMISRMRILSAPGTVECATKIMKTIIDTYFSPNRSVHELSDLLKEEDRVDLLKGFSELARAELIALDGARGRPYRYWTVA